MFNVERSQPAPDSLATEKLKSSGKCNQPDVLERLQQDFYNKCYLCEDKDITGIDVEHFLPHLNGNYWDRKFDWDNLFFCCGHCNGVKSSNQSPLLNCTNADDDVYNSLRYEFVGFPDEKLAIHPVNDAEKSKNTAELLNNIYCGKYHGGTRWMEAGNIRKRIREEIDAFEDLLLKYPTQEYQTLEQIKAKLSKQSRFSAFKRQIIKDNIKYHELMKLFD